MGWHSWEAPTPAQIKARMLERRAARLAAAAPAALEPAEPEEQEEPEPGCGYVDACPSCGRADPGVTTLGDHDGTVVTNCCEADVSALV